MNKTSKRSKFIAIAIATAATATLLTGCTININQPNASSMNGMHQGHGTYSGTDVMFAQMMIPHHQQAVDMSVLAETNTTTPEILALAKQIKEAQAPEITQMKKWLTDSDASMDMGHDMGMNGMLSDSQMDALKAAKGADFDKLYLEGMIEHHKGAIQMAQMIANSDNDEARALAEAITSSQTEEIEYMQGLLGQ